MNKNKDQIVTPDPWQKLRTITDARIGLGRCGTSLPLKEVLEFQLAHARARDAVHLPVKPDQIMQELERAGQEMLLLTSAVENRDEYLTRPDKGKLLSESAKSLLIEKRCEADISIILCGGLSSPAVHQNGVSLVLSLLDVIEKTELTLAPLCLVENGRVAIGDEVGSLLGAKVVVILIGERPGLSSPDSLGAYITLNPKPGTTDEARNCVSNIRPKGLSIEGAVQKITYIIEEAFRLGKTGVELKDRMAVDYLPFSSMIGDR